MPVENPEILPIPSVSGPATIHGPATPLPVGEPAPLPIPPVPGHTKTFGEQTVHELFHSSAEAYSAVKEEVGQELMVSLFVIGVYDTKK